MRLKYAGGDLTHRSTTSGLGGVSEHKSHLNRSRIQLPDSIVNQSANLKEILRLSKHRKAKDPMATSSQIFTDEATIM